MNHYQPLSITIHHYESLSIPMRKLFPRCVFIPGDDGEAKIHVALVADYNESRRFMPTMYTMV